MSAVTKARKKNEKYPGLEGDPVVAAALISIAKSLKKLVKTSKGATS